MSHGLTGSCGGRVGAPHRVDDAPDTLGYGRGEAHAGGGAPTAEGFVRGSQKGVRKLRKVLFFELFLCPLSPQRGLQHDHAGNVVPRSRPDGLETDSARCQGSIAAVPHLGSNESG